MMNAPSTSAFPLVADAPLLRAALATLDTWSETTVNGVPTAHCALFDVAHRRLVRRELQAMLSEVEGTTHSPLAALRSHTVKP